MNEEEKRAIECLKNRLEILHNNTQWATENSIKVVLNLIDKQQKEIEELKKEYEELYKDNLKQWEDKCKLAIELDNETVSKDKIREKIKEIENVEIDKISREEYNRKEFAIEILLELLEE